MAFAPAENPSIAVAAIVENAGFGAAHAAPIVRRVFDYWIAGQYPNEADMAAVRAGTAAAPIGKPLLASEVQMTESEARAASDEDSAAL
jgi:penicillin-binding protein 2